MVLGVNAFGYSVGDIERDIDRLFSHGMPEVQKIRIDGKYYDMDWRRLLMLTAGVESGFATGRYKGRIAKTFMQIEGDSYEWYMDKLTGTRDKLSQYTNISELKDENAIAIAYVFYLSKMFVHTSWIDKHKYIFYNNNKDVEYFVYKLFFNSIKGKTTYKKWQFWENWLEKYEEREEEKC